jgi:hypothetical protein
MYNMKTNLSIIVDSQCAKKFELDKAKLLSNNILREILKNNLLKGDYETINNIIIYSNNIQEQFIKYIEDKIENNNNKFKLLEIQNEIKELIEIYSLKYLNNIYEIINNKLIDIDKKIKEHIEFERKEKERIEFERKEKERVEFEMVKKCIEFERSHEERIEFEREEKERLEIEIKEKSRIEFKKKIENRKKISNIKCFNCDKFINTIDCRRLKNICCINCNISNDHNKYILIDNNFYILNKIKEYNKENNKHIWKQSYTFYDCDYCKK